MFCFLLFFSFLCFVTAALSLPGDELPVLPNLHRVAYRGLITKCTQESIAKYSAMENLGMPFFAYFMVVKKYITFKSEKIQCFTK